MNTADTTNWQKFPVTDSVGSLTAYIGASYPYQTVKQLLDGGINGFYTVYIDKSVSDAPDSSDNLRGIIQLQSGHVWGVLTGELTKVSYYAGGTYNGNTSDLNWVKLANDSDKVNTFDMRKPASDVAGIEEVNAKQDKIGYTPANDNDVIHTVDTTNWQKSKITNDDGTSLFSVSDGENLNARLASLSTGFFTFYFTAGCVNNPSDKAGRGFIQITYSSLVNGSDGNGIIFNENNIAYIVTILNSQVNYYELSIDSKVAHLSGANNFDTVPTVNNKSIATTDDITKSVSTKQDTIGYTPADDSKVAHLSGANNFDTVPTYGNNEIPLALNNSGSTTNRPTGQSVGYQYFDTTLNKPIWYNGSNWVDSTGATV